MFVFLVLIFWVKMAFGVMGDFSIIIFLVILGCFKVKFIFRVIIKVKGILINRLVKGNGNFF